MALKNKIINKKYLIISIVTFFSFGCVERYIHPDESDYVKQLVVDAFINDSDQEQEIILSYSMNKELPKFEPYSNCEVSVIDKDENVFSFYESENHGHYYGYIDRESLYEGNEFKIRIIDASGKHYESSTELYQQCAPIDSFYTELKLEYYTGFQDVARDGLQFYVDIRASEDYSRYYKWNITESYEYRATWPIQKYWAGRLIKLEYPDYSLFTCYQTQSINSIFTVTTEHLDENIYIKYPLHFVSNENQKLVYRYSVLLEQHAITKEAFDYWNLLRTVSQVDEGLFGKQPANVVGNVECLTNPEEEVLGYFNVSSLNQQRMFIYEVPGLDLNPMNYYCEPQELDLVMFSNDPRRWPMYFVSVEGWAIAPEECFDCTAAGGTVEPPYFWTDGYSVD